jgi:hypothetical protein
MADKQALNATFYAFRKRERGGVLVGSSVAYLVLALLIGCVFIALNLQAFLDYVHWITNLTASAENPKGGATPAAAAFMPPQSVMGLIPAYFLMLLVSFILRASYEAACLKWMIHGETGGLFGLSLGADTWRVYFTYWIWFFLLIGFYIVFALVAGGVVFAMVGASGGASNDNGAGGAMALAAPLLGLALLLALIYFAVRFAPAAATSVARRKFAFFDAWTVTKGRFWGIFGAFLLLFIIFFVFYIVVALGAGFAMGGLIAAQVAQGQQPQTSEEMLRMFANPQFAISVLIFGLVMLTAVMTLYVALFGVNARAAALALEEGKITATA